MNEFIFVMLASGTIGSIDPMYQNANLFKIGDFCVVRLRDENGLPICESGYIAEFI